MALDEVQILEVAQEIRRKDLAISSLKSSTEEIKAQPYAVFDLEGTLVARPAEEQPYSVLVPGAKKLVQRLTDVPIALALATLSDRNAIWNFFQKKGLDRFFLQKNCFFGDDLVRLVDEAVAAGYLTQAEADEADLILKDTGRIVANLSWQTQRNVQALLVTDDAFVDGTANGGVPVVVVPNAPYGTENYRSWAHRGAVEELIYRFLLGTSGDPNTRYDALFEMGDLPDEDPLIVAKLNKANGWTAESRVVPVEKQQVLATKFFRKSKIEDAEPAARMVFERWKMKDQKPILLKEKKP